MHSFLRAGLFVITIATVAVAGTIEGTALPDAVVYVDAVPGKVFPAAVQRPTLGQQGLAFVPRILAVQQGTTVEFQNNDNVQHNVFWPSVDGNKKEAHNLGTWPKGEKHSFTFLRPGVVPLLCNVHPEMSGYIVVSPTPYFAQADTTGNFRIENIPDGRYRVVVWHEGAKPEARAVEIVGSTKVDLRSAR